MSKTVIRNSDGSSSTITHSFGCGSALVWIFAIGLVIYGIAAIPAQWRVLLISATGLLILIGFAIKKENK